MLKYLLFFWRINHYWPKTVTFYWMKCGILTSSRHSKPFAIFPHRYSSAEEVLLGSRLSSKWFYFIFPIWCSLRNIKYVHQVVPTYFIINYWLNLAHSSFFGIDFVIKPKRNFSLSIPPSLDRLMPIVGV